MIITKTEKDIKNYKKDQTQKKHKLWEHAVTMNIEQTTTVSEWTSAEAIKVLFVLLDKSLLKRISSQGAIPI